MSDLNRNWRWERKGCRVYTDQMHRGRLMKVADVSIAGLDEDGLDARGSLIAAAPDLLEALQWVRTCYRPDDTSDMVVAMDAALLRASAAEGAGE